MDTWIDAQGGVYSADRKTLLKCPNVKWYRVAEGTEQIGADAFHHCPRLEEVEFPYTLAFSYEKLFERFEDDITEEDRAAWSKYEDTHWERDDWSEQQWQDYERTWYQHFGHHKFFIAPSVWSFRQWYCTYSDEYLITDATIHAIEEGEEDEFGVVYSKDGLRLLSTTEKFSEVMDYTVRNGVISICFGSLSNRMPVWGAVLPLTVHLPESVKNIDESLTDYWFKRQGNDLIFNVETLLPHED